MCGIFGAVGNTIDMNVIKLLAVLNKARGDDATGFYNGDVILKEAIASDKFLSKHRDFVNSIPDRFIMGHTRKSTCYSTDRKDECAHPFCYDNVIGTHNGIIHNDGELEKEFKETFEVDSQAIFYLLNRYAPRSKSDALRKLVGYFGLAWYDKRKPHLYNLARHGADLCIGGYNGSLYYSSSKEHLSLALPSDCEVVEVDDDSMVIINIDTLQIHKQKIEGLTLYKASRYPVLPDSNYKKVDYYDMKCTKCNTKLTYREAAGNRNLYNQRISYCDTCYAKLSDEVKGKDTYYANEFPYSYPDYGRYSGGRYGGYNDWRD